MTPHPTRWARALAGVLTVTLALVSAPRWCAAQGVQVGMTPASLNVDPGAGFDLDVTVTQAGSPFNGFDVTVSFDPAVLTLVPLSPTSLQQGCLMAGACSGACGNTFHRFSALGDSAAITDILLCDQVTLTGPGQLYRLHFTASNTPQVTHVRIRRATFYDAGLFVNPVVTADAQITIGPPVAVGEGPGAAAGIRLRAEGNPGRGAMTFALDVDTEGDQRLEVHDISGRLVRTVDHGWRAPGARRVAWDGSDASGARVPPGVYVVTLGAGERVARIRVVLLR